MLEEGATIKFNREKTFKYMKPLGKGGTGDTHLFLDETTGMKFAIKKYVPKESSETEAYYRRFVDEIKIMFRLTHPNIVRIYNYYLYPEVKTGFIQMEFIQGRTLENISVNLSIADWENIFEKMVSAFRYLEQHGILHRDIRPANIMIEDNGEAKLIDFGFGKQLDQDDYSGASILLNWPVTEHPEEITLEGLYTHQSEIYFLGWLFKKGIGGCMDIDDFKYAYIIDKMISAKPSDRYKSFNDVSFDISNGILDNFNFTLEQKKIYQKFSMALCDSINYFMDPRSLQSDSSLVLKQLSDVIRKSVLEDYIQNNSILIDVFVDGEYSYLTKSTIPVEIIREFYKLMNGLDYYKRQIILDNINVRLSSVRIKYTETNIPF
ncbi:serine/threonine protein kinase [Synergistaceae bacterium OttesenSCG-928-D05]|nr:serine/threonine protein kinase [Synergistaceae bacterium OttesenSCG-928-D05]